MVNVGRKLGNQLPHMKNYHKKKKKKKQQTNKTFHTNTIIEQILRLYKTL